MIRTTIRMSKAKITTKIIKVGPMLANRLSDPMRSTPTFSSPGSEVLVDGNPKSPVMPFKSSINSPNTILPIMSRIVLQFGESSSLQFET